MCFSIFFPWMWQWYEWADALWGVDCQKWIDVVRASLTWCNMSVFVHLCRTHVHAGMCDMSAVCMRSAGGSGMRWISCLFWNWGVTAAPLSVGKFCFLWSTWHCVSRWVYSSSLRPVSGFCICSCSSQRHFSRECVLGKLLDKASLFDALCSLSSLAAYWNQIQMKSPFTLLLMSHRFFFSVLECTTGLGHGGIQE